VGVIRQDIRRGTGTVALLVTLLAGLALAPSASAAITGSQITSPGDPAFAIYNQDNPNTIAVSGTTTGGSPGTDQVDIRCYHGTTSDLLQGGVSTTDQGGGNGSFSVSDADLQNIEESVCRLAAVPAGTTPADPSAFAGPRVGTGHRDTSTVTSGTNAGKRYDFYIWLQQLTGAFDYDSASECGLCDAYLYDSDLNLTTTTFYGGDYFYYYAGEDPASSTRSEINVDGVDAYGPQAAQEVNEDATSGFPALTYDVSQDPITGDTTIAETDQFVSCSPNALYPPDTTKCEHFVDSGVRLERTIVQNHDGHLVTITDHWFSTDGQPHSLDLLPENDQYFNDPENVAYKFPGESSFSTRAAGNVVNFPATAPDAIYLNVDGADDGDPNTGQGAIVFDKPATPATFVQINTNFAQFNLHQTATVPATGCTGFRFAYAQDYTAAAVQGLAQEALTSFATPDPACPTSSGGGTPPPTKPKKKKCKKHKKHKKHKRAASAKKKPKKKCKKHKKKKR
jgi:hypothetical protein